MKIPYKGYEIHITQGNLRFCDIIKGGDVLLIDVPLSENKSLVSNVNISNAKTYIDLVTNETTDD